MSLYCEVETEFYDETFPHARKEYVCCECSAPILVGEKHLYWKAKWDGDFAVGRQHMACRDACMAIRVLDDCIPFGSLKEWWGEYRCDYDLRKGDERVMRVRSAYARVKLREHRYQQAKRKAVAV